MGAKGGQGSHQIKSFRVQPTDEEMAKRRSRLVLSMLCDSAILSEKLELIGIASGVA